MNEIKIRIKNLRKDKNLSQAELAEALGVSRQAIIALERGDSLPSLPLFCEMIDFFQTPVDEILEIPFLQTQKINNKEGGIMKKDLVTFPGLREISSLHDMIDRVFEDQFMPQAKSDSIIPAINMHEDKNEYVIESHLSGIDENDIQVEIDDDMVTIKGEKKEKEEEKDKNYIRKEISYGSFIRQISIPSQIDTENAQANLKDGVLRIHLPKVEPSLPKVKKLEVKRR